MAGSILATGTPSDAKALPLLKLACGTTIGDNAGELRKFRLGNNLECAGTAITLGAPNMTVDLNGHRISGNGTGAGVFNNGHQSATVRNGVIDGFNDGVSLVGGKSHLVERLIVTRSADRGIEVNGAQGTIVRSNTVVDALVGIGTVSAKGVQIIANTATGSSNAGLLLSTTDNATVARNTLLANDTDGISISSSDKARIERNISNANTTGIRLTSTSEKNLIVSNTVKGNDGIGIDVFTLQNTLRSNVVTANLSFGIRLTADADKTQILENNVSKNLNDGINIGLGVVQVNVRENVVNENGTNGIVSAESDSNVSKNTTNFNGYLNGINDPVGVGVSVANLLGPSAGNKAKGNDNPGQCIPASACVVGSDAPPPGLIGCVATTSNVILRNPLSCAASGIELDGAAVDVNLNGHRIEGPGAGGAFGVRGDVASGPARIHDGVISDFAIGADLDDVVNSSARNLLINRASTTGIRARGSNTSSVTRNTVARANGQGILIENVSSVTASLNKVVASAGDGIDVFGTSSNTKVTRNTVIGVDEGIDIEDATTTTVTKNRTIGNRLGIALTNTTANVIGKRKAGNTSTGSWEHGILLEFSSNSNTLRENRLTGNDINGIRVVGSDTNTLTANRVISNSGDGVFLDALANSNTITSNQVNSNGVNGILASAGANPLTVSKNTANDNGFRSEPQPGDGFGLGIWVPATVDGGRNRAKLNDETDQCSPTSPPSFCI
jgi:parallel beta-helix repeat protein